MNYRQRMRDLRDSFPSLKRAFEGSEWDAGEVDDYAVGPAGTSGSIAAARFVLNVWNSQYEWRVGPFNLRYAFGVWDEAHRRAFVAWVNDPFLP